MFFHAFGGRFGDHRDWIPVDAWAKRIFKTLGSCVIDADQTGDDNWNAATTMQQAVTVDSKGDQTIAFTSTAPADATAGVKYLPTATAGSGLTVTFTTGTASVCTVSGADDATVTFIAAGLCTINAKQSGNENWNPAAQQSQSFTVAGRPPVSDRPCGSLANSTGYGSTHSDVPSLNRGSSGKADVNRVLDRENTGAHAGSTCLQTPRL